MLFGQKNWHLLKQNTERAAVREVAKGSPIGEYSIIMIISHPSAAELAAGYTQHKLKERYKMEIEHRTLTIFR